MSNNVLGCSSLWVADCEHRGVWCGISRTKVASVLASIWSSTGECAVAVMNMDVVLWKGGHLGVIRHLSWMVQCTSQDAESHLSAPSPLPQHHIHVHHCHSTLTGTASYWSQHGDSFCSTNTTSHTPEFTVRYPQRTTFQGIITH